MPVPSAVMLAWTSVFFSTRSMRAFSTLMILPRSGRIAWNIESRPLFAEPPAESPSTTYSSDLRGSVERQSATLPGRPPMSVALLRRTSSRALRAAALVGPALVGADGVGKGVDRRRTGGIPLHRDLHLRGLALAGEVSNALVDRGFRPVDVFDEVGRAARVMEGAVLDLVGRRCF